MDRKAAAEARRAKVLARGGDRLAKITGTLQDSAPISVTPPDAPAQTQPAASSLAAPSPPLAAAVTQSSPLPPPPPAASAPAVAAAAAPAAPADAAIQRPPSVASELGAALWRSTSAAELPQRRVGTATNGKWAQYEGPDGGGGGAGGQQRRRRLRQVSTGETLSASVQSTRRARLLLAVLLAVLLAWRWDMAQAGVTLETSAVAACGASVLSPPPLPPMPPPAPGLLFAELAARWQHILRQARPFRIALQWCKGAAGGSDGMQQAQQAAPAPAGAAAGRHHLLGSMAQRARRQLAAAAASPLGRQVGAAAQAVAASPAGRSATAVLKRVGEQVAAAAASPAGQRAAAGVHGLGAQLARLPELAHARVLAAAASPVGQQGLAALEKLPPLANLVLLDLSIIGAAAMVLAAAPNLVHSTLELELQSPGLLMRLAGYVPGLQQQLSLALAWQGVVAALLDDAAAFVAALVCYQLVPQVAAGAEAWLQG